MADTFFISEKVCQACRGSRPARSMQLANSTAGFSSDVIPGIGLIA